MSETTFRRGIFTDSVPGPTSHAGLWLDRFLKGKADQDKANLVRGVAEQPIPTLYSGAYNRWSAGLATVSLQPQSEGFTVVRRAFEVQGRMVIGLGMEATLENHITLHHTYGVPLIPGSALKGLAASYAHRCLTPSDSGWSKGDKPRGEAKPFHQTLFGDTTSAGFVTFFDAWYIPGSAQNDAPLQRDVLTVHHQAYYQSDQPPADWDSPIPVPFLSATGCYLVILAGPQLWTQMALNLLGLALKEEGVGAKTSSGYGRMQPVDETQVRGQFRRAGARENPQTTPTTAAQPTPAQTASQQHPQSAIPAANPRAAQPDTAALHSREAHTAEGKVGGVGAQDAAIELAGGKRGRARFGAALQRKPKYGELVRVELDDEGRPVLIVEIL